MPPLHVSTCFLIGLWERMNQKHLPGAGRQPQLKELWWSRDHKGGRRPTSTSICSCFGNACALKSCVQPGQSSEHPVVAYGQKLPRGFPGWWEAQLKRAPW